MNGGRLKVAAIAAAVLVSMTGAANAAKCGNTDFGFESWKKEFSGEAQGRVGQRAIAALMATHYAHPTINADRNQHSFHLTLPQFLAKRGGSEIVSQGRVLKRRHAALFQEIQSRYGVPAGPLLAIWGMETGFGSVHGNQNMLSSVATLAYDCRRTEYFTDQLYAALKLVDRGTFSNATRGSMHGEVGQTQFMPKSVLQYGVGNMETPSGALNSTANFLRAHGWQRGAGYQPGQPNFAAIQGWNAASVYQQAIAKLGAEIDGGGE
ncbi:MAG: lytic murein transglycosylase [Hyphomicrobiales bacterium]|nr:lytic murein transglycosylase [Hyphomicrobiales bacterium]